jgi:hypothetical protein
MTMTAPSARKAHSSLLTKPRSTTRPRKRASAAESGLVCPHSRMACAQHHHRCPGGSAHAKKPRAKAIRIPLDACGYLWQARREGGHARSVPSFLVACLSGEDISLGGESGLKAFAVLVIKDALAGRADNSAFAGRANNDAFSQPANNSALAGRADLPRMRTTAVRALILARPARGNHTRQGTGSRSGPGFAFSPLTRVVGLRPGRPRMRTLRAHLFCADALWAFSGADRALFAIGGAGLARQFFPVGDRCWVSSVGADSRCYDQTLRASTGSGRVGWSR